MTNIVTTMRVLVLAEAASSEAILHQIERQDWTVEIDFASSTGDFLAQLGTGSISAGIVQMGNIEGLSASKILQMAATESPETPVVVIAKDDGQLLRCMNEGAANCISAGHLHQLPAILRRLFRERNLLERNRKLENQVRQAHAAILGDQKLVSIGRLTASIAHEINNPLESITNLLYLLRTEPGISPQAEHYVGLAEREMGRVAQISKQTLSFYRETETAVWVNPSELLDEVLSLYGRRIADRRIQVVRQFESDANLLIFPGEMRQVFSNLVTNAIEASPVGGTLVLKVHSSRLWSDDGVTGLRIVVADRGCGISAETRKHIGQLFYTTKGQRGTGLGLWVTRAIVQRYGGKIRVYSSTDAQRHGTVFSVFMPTNLRPHAVKVEEAVPAATGTFGRGRVRTVGEVSSGNPHQVAEIGEGRFSSDAEKNHYRSRFRNPRVAS